MYLLPLKDFCHGIFHGVTGIIADPYYGAKKGEQQQCLYQRSAACSAVAIGLAC